MKGEHTMDYLGITKEYYAQWLGVAPGELDKQGMHFVHSPQRNVRQKGYGEQYDVFMWIAQNRIIVSYGDKAAGKIGQLKNGINSSMQTEDAARILQSVWGIVPSRLTKFVYDSLPKIETKAYKMTAGDVELYKAFFMAYSPNATDISWLDEYYNDIVSTGFCYGEMIFGKLVCMNDLPGMPYMENVVREIGINTLPDYRQKGLARRVCTSCIHAMVQSNICPQWSTQNTNEASARLAHSIGFKKMADVMTITL